MASDSWNEARLIPTSGINGAEEQERRATSALLAVLSSVKEFGRVICQPLGAPAGTIETYIEVPFELGERRVYPDGLIRVTRGKRTWTALVEVKTSKNELKAEQLEDYLDVARIHGYDALLTISNELAPTVDQHPTSVDKRKLKKVALHHISWTRVLSEAVMQKEHRGVADPDQAWILGELIRYLEHPKSGALEFESMGSSWVPVRDAVRNSTLRVNDKGVQEVVTRFDALVRYACLKLGRTLGTDVVPVLSRKEAADPEVRSQVLTSSLVNEGKVEGTIRIPDAVGPLSISADLRSGLITCRVNVEAPRQGRPTTRVNWLVRQLRNASENLRIEAFVAHMRGPGQTELLRLVREDPAVLVADPKRELRSFEISQTSPLGMKNGTGRGSFIDSMLGSIDDFYRDAVQDLKAWSAAPPKLREPLDQLPTGTSLDSNALSSQDDPSTEPMVSADA